MGDVFRPNQTSSVLSKFLAMIFVTFEGLMGKSPVKGALITTAITALVKSRSN